VHLTSITALAATGFAVAFFHAALPTHWLPFVLVGRVQGWRTGKVLAVTGLAGAGHVLFTAALGLGLTGAGLALAPRLGQLFPKAVGGLLIALGLFYLARHLQRRGHSHGDASNKFAGRSDIAAIVGLVMVLTFSPCEVFLPVYLANVGSGWGGFLLLSAVLVIGTGLAMLLFTSLCLAGFNRFRLERLEHYEGAVIGVVLCLLGVAVALES
jgi:nickel/cobalt exporter